MRRRAHDPGPHRPMRPIGEAAQPTLGENLRACRLGFAWSAPLASWLRVRDDLDHPGLWLVDLAPERTDLPKSPDRDQPVYRAWWEPDGLTDPLLVQAVADALGLDEQGHVTSAASFTMDDDGRRVA